MNSPAIACHREENFLLDLQFLSPVFALRDEGSKVLAPIRQKAKSKGQQVMKVKTNLKAGGIDLIRRVEVPLCHKGHFLGGYMRSRIANFSRRLALPLVLVTIVAGSSSSARAQYEYQTWTTVASAGTVDQKDVSLVQFDGPVASLASGAPDQSTLHIRYNVVPVDGLFEKPCTGYLLNVRYRDEFSSGGSFTVYDPGIEVIVTLKSINLGDGVVNTLLSFDSNTFPAAYGFQTQGSPPGYFTFDFRNNAYWIEAQLIRGQLSSYSWLRYHPSPAALATVQILSFNCAY